MKRSDSKRAHRMGDQIMREVAEILATEVQDPRLDLVTVSGARMNANLRVAEVLYTTARDKAEAAAEALEKARGFVRRALGQRLQSKFLPELRFVLDAYLEDMIYGSGQTPDS